MIDEQENNNSIIELEIKETDDENKKFLEAKSSDKIASLLKGFLGGIPYVGSMANEIVSWLIPNQRMDRVCNFIKQLASQVTKLEDYQKTWIEKLKNSKNDLLLFELAVRYSLETNSAIKHHCYAYYVFNTIQNKKYKDIQHEKILRTLAELTEEEILQLIRINSPKEAFDFSKDLGNKTSKAFYEEYMMTLDQKGLISIAMKYSGSKLPLDKNGDDITITDYGCVVLDAIYDEDFFFSPK